jgi:hypothetical protein
MTDANAPPVSSSSLEKPEVSANLTKSLLEEYGNAHTLETSLNRTRTGRRRILRPSEPNSKLNNGRTKQRKGRRKSRPYFEENIGSKAEGFKNAEDMDLLKEKILSQLGNMDPLLCLPKALCGLSSRQYHSQSEKDNNVGLGLDATNDDVLTNYYEIMKTVVQ